MAEPTAPLQRAASGPGEEAREIGIQRGEQAETAPQEAPVEQAREDGRLTAGEVEALSLLRSGVRDVFRRRWSAASLPMKARKASRHHWCARLLELLNKM
jgi:hypothetical protein